MSRHLLFIICFLSFFFEFSSPLFAQKLHEIDSLKQALTVAQDTQRVRIFYKLSTAYQYTDLDTAMQYAQESQLLAEQLGDEKGKGDALLSQGRLKREKGDYAEALEDLTASLEIYEKLQDSVQIANALNDISIVYAVSGDDEKALEYFEETLSLFQAIGDTKGVSHMLNNIGVIHRSAGRLDLAKDYFMKALKLKEARKDSISLPRSYANIGSLFNDLGDENQAWYYYRKADSLFRVIQDMQGLSSNLSAMAQLLQAQGKLTQAKALAVEALSIAQETKVQVNIQKMSQQLAELSEQQGNFPAAYRYLQMSGAAKDSLYNQNQTKHLDELKAQFDSEKQTARIAMLEKDKQLQQVLLQRQTDIKYVLLGGITLLLILLFVFINMYRLNRRQKILLSAQNKEISLQKEELGEINRTKDRFFSILSHDIKGPLNTLKGFVFLLSQQAETMSRKEVRQMSEQIGESLQNLHQLLDNLLTWSLSQIQQQRLSREAVSLHNLTADIFRLHGPTASEKDLALLNKVDANIHAWADHHSINTVLRNLVANSIKFSYPQTPITVEASVDGDKVLVQVTDEGTGMDQPTMDQLFSLDKKTVGVGTANEKGSGFGLVLCEELIRKNGGQLWVTSKKGEGSTFSFSLPYVQTPVVDEVYGQLV